MPYTRPELTPLERAILLVVLVGPLQHTSEIEMLLGRPPRFLHRSVKALLQRGLLGEVNPPCLGRPRGLLYLTRRGMQLVATTIAATEIAWYEARWRANAQALAHLVIRLPALVTVQEQLPLLIAAIHTALARTHVGIDGDQSRWYWVRDYRSAFRQNGRLVQVRVEGVFVLEQRSSASHDGEPLRYGVWLLLDPGIGAMSALLPRLEALYRLREHQRAAGITAFPPVWIMARSPYRASLWRRAARRCEQRLQVASLAGVIQVAPATTTTCWPLGHRGNGTALPMGEGAWTRLETGERTTLEQLFVHLLPVESVPVDIVPPAPPSDLPPLIRDGPPPLTRSVLERLGARRTRMQLRTTADKVGVLGMAALMTQLTQSELHLLDLLAAHPLLGMSELVVLLGYATTHSLRTNLVTPLEQRGLIAQTPVPGETLAALSRHPELPVPATVGLNLTPTGWRLLAAVYQLPRRHLSGWQDGAWLQAHAQTHGAHSIGVYRFFAWLIAAARQQNALHQVLWWETGNACVRRVGTLPGSQEAVYIRPDGIGEYAWGTRRLRFWLEWDMGTEDLAELREKLLRYAAYAQSRRYWDEAPRSLPVLLLVVPTTQREEAVTRLVEALLREGILLPHGCLAIRSTTFAFLAYDGPLGPIWRNHMPRRTLTSLVPLLEAIRPLPPFAQRPPTVQRRPGVASLDRSRAEKKINP